MENMRRQTETVTSKFIRQSRVHIDELCVATEGKLFPVVDFSITGISLLVPRHYDVEELQKITLVYKEEEIGAYDVDYVRSEDHDEDLQKAAYRIHRLLDYQQIQAALLAHNAMDYVENKDFEIDRDFKLGVYEIRAKLSNLKKYLLSEDAGYDYTDYREKEKVEQQAAERVGRYIESILHQFFSKMTDLILPAKQVKNPYVTFFYENLNDLLLLNPFSKRSYEKPLSYAGDYEMMNLLYRNEALGRGIYEKALQYYYMNHLSGAAVRNRIEYFKERIAKFVSERPGKTLRILSVASGPAQEVQAILREIDPATCERIEINLLDQDLGSLEYVQANLLKIGLERNLNLQVNYIQRNIKDVIKNGLEQNYDLIYSAGLFDYLTDPVAQLLARNLMKGLNSGGELVVGNFKSFPEYDMGLVLILDWVLIYRNEKRLEELYAHLADTYSLEAEKIGMNLFAVLGKN